MRKKYFIFNHALLFASLALSLYITACSKKDPAPSDQSEQQGGGGENEEETGNENDSELYISFKAPDWSQKIDCSKLNFAPQSCSDSVLYVYATSQSTKAVLYIAYPLDSTTVSKIALNKKFPMYVDYCDYRSNLQEAITFFVAVPQKSGDASTYWIPTRNFADNNYTIVKKIKYLESDTHYAKFLVAGSYSSNSILTSMSTGQLNTNGMVSGDFQLIIWADRVNIGDQPDHLPRNIKANGSTYFEGSANQTLNTPLTVQVQNDWGMYLAKEEVQWVVTKGGGKVSADKTLTDYNGRTSVEWTLGASGQQEVEARVSRYDGKPVEPLVFTATVK